MQPSLIKFEHDLVWLSTEEFFQTMMDTIFSSDAGNKRWGQNLIPPKIKEEVLRISKQISICVILSKEYLS